MNMHSNRFISWTIILVFSVILALGLFYIVRPFIEGFVWALILVLITWPAFNYLKKSCFLSDQAASLTLTLALTALSLLILVPGSVQLGKELYLISSNKSITVEAVNKNFSNLPLLANFVDSAQLNTILKSFLSPFVEFLLKLARQASQAIVSSLLNIGVMLLTSYFLYRNGKALMSSLESVVTFYGGPKWSHYFVLIENTIKSVVYGALLTAPAQGILAGIGFYVAGAPMPVVCALVTFLFSFIPFGAPMIYVPVSVYLFVNSDSLLASIGLLFWGVAVVSTIDNIIRPIFISHAIKISLLLIFVGVVGGIAAFGLLGLFIGPVIIAVTQTLWKELVESSVQKTKACTIEC